MAEFLRAVLVFPTALFTFLLLIVLAYWLSIVAGLLDLDDGDAAWLGLGGVPAGVTVSLLIALAWLFSLIGGQLAGGALLLVVLFAAVGLAWLATRALLIPLRPVFAPAPQPTRTDFVGQRCVIRTGEVTNDFGQAEVVATDGSSAVVQVRTTGADRLVRGQKALIFDYDADGEFFWVMAHESEL